MGCSHIHSKTACRGFESFCPCQKSQVSHLRYLTFFVSERDVLATRSGCALRSACRGGLQPCGLRPGPTEPAGKTESSHSTSTVLIHFHLFPTASIPSSTQNAPGFAFFGLFRVRFCVFRPSGRTKFTGWFLCRLPHYHYRIKSLLIPSPLIPYSFSNASYLPYLLFTISSLFRVRIHSFLAFTIIVGLIKLAFPAE